MSKKDWKKIYKEYISGVSIKDLAEKYGGNYSYFRRRLSQIKKDSVVGRVRQRALEIERLEEQAQSEDEIEKRARSLLALKKEYRDTLRMLRRKVVRGLIQEPKKGVDLDKGSEIAVSMIDLKKLKYASEIISRCRFEDWEVDSVSKGLEEIKSGQGIDPGELTDEEKKKIIREAKKDLE